MNRTTRIARLAGAALALAAAGAFAQQPQVAPRGTSAQPRIPFGNEMGFFRPRPDPALTRIVPPTPPGEPAPTPPTAEELAKMPAPSLEERLRWSEQQMDRAESEAALQRAQVNQYIPGPATNGLPTPIGTKQ